MLRLAFSHLAAVLFLLGWADPAMFAEPTVLLVSRSSRCSLTLGDHASIDSSDGAGMNMMDLKTQVSQASRIVLPAFAPNMLKIQRLVVATFKSFFCR